MRTFAIIMLIGTLIVEAWGQEQNSMNTSRMRRRENADGVSKRREFGERQRPEGSPDMMIMHLLKSPRFSEELGLTEEQRETIEKEQLILKENNAALHEQMKEAALEQARLMTADEIDETSLMAAVEKTGALRTEMAKLRIRHLLFMKKTLSAEQIEKARSLISEKMEKREAGKTESRRGKQGREEGHRPFRPRREMPSSEFQNE